MSKNTNCPKIEGVITKVINATTFKVKLINNEIIEATITGKMKFHHISIIQGDKVLIMLNEYEPNKGIIILRY